MIRILYKLLSRTKLWLDLKTKFSAPSVTNNTTITTFLASSQPADIPFVKLVSLPCLPKTVPKKTLITAIPLLLRVRMIELKWSLNLKKSKTFLKISLSSKWLKRKKRIALSETNLLSFRKLSKRNKCKKKKKLMTLFLP